MGKRRRKGRQFWAEADRQCPGTPFEPAAECKVQGKMGILEGRRGGQTHLAVFLFGWSRGGLICFLWPLSLALEH